jgi:hypothetical protein
MNALRAAPGRGTNQAVVEHAEVAWKALHDPALIGEVLAGVYGASVTDTRADGIGAINRAILRAAAKEGPVIAVPKNSTIGDGEFFKNWIGTGRRFFDLGIDTQRHGQTTHLIQDLIVDEAFKRAGLSMNASTFRNALAGAVADGIPDPGNRLWIRIFDGFDTIGTPENLMPALRLVPGLEGLR